MNQPPLPPTFLDRMQEMLPADFAQFEQIINTTAAITSVRLNPSKLMELPKNGRSPVPWHPEGYYLAERPSFTADPLFHGGAYYVQEASSMLLYQFIDFSKDLTILDLCAAPGGKSTLIAGAMSSGSLLVSNEVIAHRASILKENMIRWGNPQIFITQSDPKVLGKLTSFFDVIVVDAPCSGEGMFRKDPAARETWSEEIVELCAPRQKRILADILPALKEGGSLIYCTCTFSKSENEEVIAWLLSEFKDDLQLDPQEGLASYGAIPVEIHHTPSAAYRCYPHVMKGEGMFFSRLTKIKRASDLDKYSLNSSKSKKARKKKSSSNKNASIPSDLTKRVHTFLATYVKPIEPNHITVYKDQLVYVPIGTPTQKINGLYIIQQGIPLGNIHRKEITPTHELALSNLIHPDIPRLALTYEAAIKYLQRENLKMDIDLPPSWIVVSYEGVNLGWVKKVKQQLKNQLPLSWRIRQKIV